MTTYEIKGKYVENVVVCPKCARALGATVYSTAASDGTNHVKAYLDDEANLHMFEAHQEDTDYIEFTWTLT
jgi:hypothetical protein